MPVQDWVAEALALPGVFLLDLSPTRALEAALLPSDELADPADRMRRLVPRSLDTPMLRPAAFALVFLVLACEPPADVPPPDTEPVAERPHDIEGARATVHEFHQGLARGDSVRVLELLHPDAVIYEAGHAETVEEYRAGHLAADIEFAAAVEREILHDELVPLGEGVLYLAETRAVGTFRGRDVDARGAETVLLSARNGEWRIRHVHWSSR